MEDEGLQMEVPVRYMYTRLMLQERHSILNCGEDSLWVGWPLLVGVVWGQGLLA